MAEEPGIDPRYAAQFQRGYDPARHAPAPPSTARSGPVRIAGGPPPAVERVPPPPPLVVREPEPEVTPSEPETSEPAPRSLATRLLGWALPAVGGVLLLASFAVLQDALGDERIYSGYSDSAGYIWSQVRNSLPGPLFVAGVTALTAWVVLLGLRSPASP